MKETNINANPPSTQAAGSGDKGSQMKCNKCLTEWWTNLAGDCCPNCDPKYGRLRSTIRLTLETKRDELRERRAKIDALEELESMCQRLEKGM